MLTSIDPTCDGSSQVGYPVLLKATGGGGGIGIYICHSKDDLVKNFETAGRCDLHVWDCMCGIACMGLHIWDCMCGTACMGLHVWDCMYRTVCRVADVAVNAFLSSKCISAEAIVHPIVMTLYELQILQL